MTPRPRRLRRLLVPAILGAILAGEITGIALARTLPPVIVPVAAPAAVATGTPTATLPTTDRAAELEATNSGDAGAEIRVGVDLAARRATPNAEAHGVSLASKARMISSSVRGGGGGPSASPKSYHGVNHVWIPSLGINRSVQSFPCSRSRPPDAGVYRWGCAGHNNVYLMSHAWSTFKPLHDAYVRGSLRKGMRVIYADGGGHVHTYAVIWWRVTAPTTAASWAWASLSSPGMTLQTCVGSQSQYRLMVRLTRIA